MSDQVPICVRARLANRRSFGKRCYPTILGTSQIRWSCCVEIVDKSRLQRFRLQRRSRARRRERSCISSTKRNAVFGLRIGIWILRSSKVRSWLQLQVVWGLFLRISQADFWKFLELTLEFGGTIGYVYLLDVTEWAVWPAFRDSPRNDWCYGPEKEEEREGVEYLSSWKL